METRGQGHIDCQWPWKKASHIPQLCYLPFQDTTEALICVAPLLSPDTFRHCPYHTAPSCPPCSWLLGCGLICSEESVGVKSLILLPCRRPKVGPEVSAPTSILADEQLQAWTLTPWSFGKHVSAPSRTPCQPASEEEARSCTASGSLLKLGRPAWTPEEDVCPLWLWGAHHPDLKDQKGRESCRDGLGRNSKPSCTPPPISAGKVYCSTETQNQDLTKNSFYDSNWPSHFFFMYTFQLFFSPRVISPANYLKKKGVQCPSQYRKAWYVLTPFLKGISQSCTNTNQLLHFVRQVVKKPQFINA